MMLYCFFFVCFQALSEYTLVLDMFQSSGKFAFLSQKLNEMKKQVCMYSIRSLKYIACS